MFTCRSLLACAFGCFFAIHAFCFPQEPKPSEAPVEVTLPSDPLERLANDTLFVVELKYGDDKLPNPGCSRVQVGFLVAPDLGVTALSGLLKSRSSTARFASEKRTVSLTVLGGDPKLDLAVVRFKRSAAVEASATSEVGAALTRDAGTEPMDAAHFTLFCDPTGKDQPRALAMAKIQPERNEEGDAARGSEGRIYANATTAKLSGLPIVDAEGSLAGMWQWSWAEAELVEPRIVPVRELRRLVAAVVAEPLKSFDQTFEGVTIRPRCMPLLKWKTTVASNAETQTAKNTSKNLWKKLYCSICKGKGYEDNPGLEGTRPIVRRDDCDFCKKSGLIDESKRWEVFRSLAAALTNVPPNTKLDSIALEFENGLAQAIDLNRDLLLEHSIADGARQELLNDELTPGRGVVFRLSSREWPTEDSNLWGERVRVIRSSQYGKLLLRAPFARSTINEGDTVVVVAAIAGQLSAGDQTYTVLERAIAVPVKPASLPAGR